MSLLPVESFLTLSHAWNKHQWNNVRQPRKSSFNEVCLNKYHIHKRIFIWVYYLHLLHATLFWLENFTLLKHEQWMWREQNTKILVTVYKLTFLTLLWNIKNLGEYFCSFEFSLEMFQSLDFVLCSVNLNTTYVAMYNNMFIIYKI